VNEVRDKAIALMKAALGNHTSSVE